MDHDTEESSTKTADFKPGNRPRRIKRCTVVQKKALVNYMSTHTRLARYECDPITSRVEWKRLANTLNQCGTIKTVAAWKVTWRDLRRKAAKDEDKARAKNTKISEISGKIREIMADSDEDLIGMPRNICLSPTQPASVQSQAEESDQDQDLETCDMAIGQESLVQTIEAQARASPSSELESLQAAPESSSDSSPCTSPTPSNKARCSQDQINTLVDCMAINTSMAFGIQNTPKKAEDWRRLRQFLNRIGPAKRTVAWQKTWRDLKRSAVISGRTKSPWIKPSTKKILAIIEAYTQKLRDQPNELSADDSELFLPSEGTSVQRAPLEISLSDYLILPNEGRSKTSKIRDVGKHGIVKESPGRRSSSKVLPVDNSTRETSPASFQSESDDSDSESLGSQQSRKVKKMRCTNDQKYAIVDYMARHPSVAASRASDGDYYAKWRQLTKYLNKIGTAKTTTSWQRTWRDIKKSARCNRENPKWADINERILRICENASKVNRAADAAVKPARENDEACPTEDIPLLSSRRQTEQSPEVVLCEEDPSNDITEPKQYRKHSQSDQSREVSPERHNSIAPRQRSEQTSAVNNEKELSQQSKHPKFKNTRCTPSQINALLSYMAKHPSLAKAKSLYMPKGRDPWYSEWRHLTKYLNRLHKMGPAKSTTGWKCTWRSLCLNARRKKSKHCPSYDRVYKKVLNILGEDPIKDGPTGTKVRTTENGTRAVYMRDPLESVKDRPDGNIKHKTQPALNSSHRMSARQRGSRMSPVRISDKVSPVRRSSGRVSPGRSGENRLVRLSPVTENHANLVELENDIRSSRERWGRKPKKIRSSNDQLRALADYMIAHPNLARDKYIGHRDPAWVRLTKYLNDIGPARKRTEAWKRTWREIKNGVRARWRRNQLSGCLESFREEKVLELIGMASPDRRNAVGSDDDNMDEDYLMPEPEVILTPSDSSHHTQYDLSEILARSSPTNDSVAESETDRRRDKEAPAMEALATKTSLLQTLLQEVRHSNELHVEENGYLREILNQLKTQQCTHVTRHSDRESPVNHGNNTHEAKQEILDNALEIHIQAADSDHSNEVDDSLDEIPIKPIPVIRPVSLSSLTSTPKQPLGRIKVHSLLQGKVKPATPKGKLIRLKDGTMVLVPETIKKQTTA